MVSQKGSRVAGLLLGGCMSVAPPWPATRLQLYGGSRMYFPKKSTLEVTKYLLTIQCLALFAMPQFLKLE